VCSLERIGQFGFWSELAKRVNWFIMWCRFVKNSENKSNVTKFPDVNALLIQEHGLLGNIASPTRSASGDVVMNVKWQKIVNRAKEEIGNPKKPSNSTTVDVHRAQNVITWHYKCEDFRFEWANYRPAPRCF
jgi:hypothetical protein